MKQPKKFEALMYSTIGVAFLFILIVGVNLIFSPVRVRKDMTADKLFTLSDGTKKILKKVDSPITINYYCSQGENRMPSQMKSFAQNVEDLLAEFKAQNPANIQIKKFDPKPDSDVEDQARLDGIEPQQLNTGEPFYLGVSVNLEPQKVALPFLAPQRERLLEYDLARAIARVLNTKKPVVGLMSPLPISGMPTSPMMMRQRGQDPWVFLSELKRDFDVQIVPIDTEKVDENVKVLLAVHPKNLSDKTQYAIDQFIMRGGKLVAFLDPACLVDPANQNNGMNMGGSGSSLPLLLKAWGVDFDVAKVVADRSFMKQVGGPDGRPRTEPCWLFVNPKGINAQDVIMNQVDDILMPCAGVFTGTPVPGLAVESLMHTTKDSQLVDSFMATMGGGQKLIDDFKPGDKEMNLAVRLSGKFKTAFPNGKPEGEDKDKKDAAKEESIKECKDANVVYLVGDVDMMYDNFCVQKMPMFGIIQPFNGNLTFIQSLVEQMAGDSDLIGVRSRATIRHPFTVVEDMKADAQKRFQAKISEFEKQAQNAQQRIAEIQSQSKKDGSQRFILPPEAKTELAKLQKIQIDANKELRRIRKELRQEEESLENRMKWINIAAMPCAVAFVGLVLAGIRKKRTMAK